MFGRRVSLLLLVAAFVVPLAARADDGIGLKYLQVGKTLFNESLDPFDGPFRNARRYVMDTSEFQSGSKQYEVRISYLGSPPAAYTMSLFRAPRAKVLQLLQGTDRHALMKASSSGGPTRRLFDTERLEFQVEDLSTMPIVLQDDSQTDQEADLVPIVEVRTLPWGKRRDGRSVLPPGEGIVFYNIKLDPIIFGVPATMLPVVIVGAVASLAVLLFVLPLVLLWIQRGHDSGEAPNEASSAGGKKNE